MRILACADLHGRLDRIARVRALAAEHAPAVVVLPGDLTHAGMGEEEALKLLGGLAVPVFAVPGNMDGPRVVAELAGRGALAGRSPAVVGGVTFGGPHVASPCDVLVTHEPPVGTLDVARSGQHSGSRAVLNLMRALRPRVLTCGHVHERPGVERVGDTLVVNCTMGDGKTGGALIELTPGAATARLL